MLLCGYLAYWQRLDAPGGRRALSVADRASVRRRRVLGSATRVDAASVAAIADRAAGPVVDAITTATSERQLAQRPS